jgi:hypothetical protein
VTVRPCVGERRRSSFQLRQEQLDERTDAQRIRERADPDGPAQQPPDRKDHELNARADQSDRVTSFGKAGHEPVARAWSKLRTDVQGGREGVAHDAGEQKGRTRGDRFGSWQHGQGSVDRKAYDDDIADRAGAWPLP